jgi:peroxiredoxin
MGAARVNRTLEPGARAPEFTLQTLDGKGSQTLSEARTGGRVLLAFFKISCPVCQYSMPFIERIFKGSKGTAHMFAVSQDDASDTREFNKEFGITMPTLLDTEEQGYPASNAYGLTNVPSMFLIEPDGKISWSLVGFHKKELEALGAQFGVSTFRAGDNPPESKAG